MEDNLKQIQQNLKQIQQNHSSDDDVISMLNFEKQEKIIKKKFYLISNVFKKSYYIAKITTKTFDLLPRREIISFYQEVYINIKLNHPSILKLIGYSLTSFKDKPKPVILYEYSSKYSLQDKYLTTDFNDTKKLINLFGIASGMSYLHSHNIIHRKLILENIFLDEFLYPKISQFFNSIEIEKNNPFKETTLNKFEYLAPEVLTNLEYSKSNDVFSFALIMYEILCKKKLTKFFEKLSISFDFFTKDCQRPKFEEPINETYKNLIERCWSHDPKMRPTFDEIVYELKNNSNFITEKVDKEEFFKYIKFIEESPILFNDINTKMPLEELLKLKKIAFNGYYTKINKKEQFFNGYELDITNYQLLNHSYKRHGYKIYNSRFLDKKYCMAQVYSNEINFFSKQEIINFQRKLSIISQLNHPAILNFIGFSQIDFDGKNKPVIITEDIVFDSIPCMNQVPRWDQTKKLITIYGIASAMAYLHSHDIIHRDLKTSNICVDGEYLPK